MWSYETLPTFWSNDYSSTDKIRADLRVHDPNGEYAHLFSQFGSDHYEYERTPINEMGMRLMLSPWILDLERMSARKQWKHDFPKPCVTIFGEINTKGNLCIFWEPTSYGEDHGTDFTMLPYPGSNQWGERPTRELAFFRGVLEPLTSLTGAVHEPPRDCRRPVSSNYAAMSVSSSMA